MRRWWMATVLAALVTVFSFAPAQAGEKVRMATLDWEPYIGQSLRNQGFVAEIIRAAFFQAGIEVELDFLPWARAVKMAADGRYDGYGPEYMAEEVKRHSLFSDPFPGGPLGLFRKKGRNITYKTLDDLKPYRIGVVRGYVNTREFDAADFLTKEEAPDDLTNLKKLVKNRLDLVVADKYVGLYLAQRHLGQDAGMVEFVEPALEMKELYWCFSLKAPGHETRVRQFNEGLKKITADGSIRRIMKAHGF